jgi:hypothetical protein
MERSAVKLVLFDLGDTLENAGVLRPGALETLDAIASLRTNGQAAVLLGLVSDYHMPDHPSDVGPIQQQYYSLLDDLGIRAFFEPVAERVTLSTEVGVFKPDEAVFRTAASKISPDLDFKDIFFVTENIDHVHAAGLLGLEAVHVRGPGQPDGGLETLAELVPLVRAFLDNGEPVETTVVDVPPATRSTVMNRVAATGATWTRLGDVLVVRTPVGAGERSGHGDMDGDARRLFISEERLHVVTQIGRTFQEDHPDARVIVDKGRYLVVDADPGAPQAGPHASCYSVRPLPAGTVVFDERPAGHGAVPDGSADTAAAGLSPESFRDDVDRLAFLRTRHSRSAEFLGALEWAEDGLQDLGFATSVQAVPVPGGTSRNLIAERSGAGSDRKVVLVTAHLDSVNTDGMAAAAPGADDNASGSAGVLAIARALAGRQGKHDLRLILFGGEEQGLFGSRHYVAGLDGAERARISAVLNMDMIACLNSSLPTVLLEGAPVSQPVMDALAGIARKHTSLAVQTSLNPFNSDHVPFIDLGIPAVLTIEGTDSANDRVHSGRDTLETLDISLAMEILRMNATFVAQEIGLDM